MNNNIKAAELLEQAADKFESGDIHWGQGDYHFEEEDGSDSWCYIGGLVHANDQYLFDTMTTSVVHWNKSVKTAIEATARHLEREGVAVLDGSDVAILNQHDTVVSWNDELPENTGRDQVVNVMRYAAKDLRNES